jgi:hypothetical protein
VNSLARFPLAFAIASTAVSVAACGSSGAPSSATGGAAGARDDGSPGSGNRGGRSGSGAKGDFDSIWRRSSAEVAALGTSVPSAVRETHLELPAKFEHPEYGTEVETFEQIKGDALIVYAHFDDSEVYHRLHFPLMGAGGSFTWIGKNATGVYELHDGALRLTMTQQTNTAVIMTTTHYEPYTGDFPPPDWPTEAVDVERSDRAGAP